MVADLPVAHLSALPFRECRSAGRPVRSPSTARPIGNSGRGARPAPTPKRHPPRRHAVGGPARTILVRGQDRRPRPPSRRAPASRRMVRCRR